MYESRGHRRLALDKVSAVVGENLMPHGLGLWTRDYQSVVRNIVFIQMLGIQALMRNCPVREGE